MIRKEQDHTRVFEGLIAKRRGDYLNELGELVAVPCGTEMVEGVNRVADMVQKRLNDLGLKTERHPAQGFGDHLTASTGAPGRQTVLGGHLDTTYTDYSSLPGFRLDGDYAVGPGTSDMKGGILVFLIALDCLKAAGLLDSLPLTVAFNSDEERGAPSSRALFQRLAGNARAALFSECGGPDGELVIARRGKISYRIDVAGQDMHAGDGRKTKRSALLGLSHKIIEFEALNRVFEGTSVNLGKAWGGVASNTVPGQAAGLLDIRYPRADMEAELRAAVEDICAREHVEGVTARATETSYRPVWEDRKPGGMLVDLVRKLLPGREIRAEARNGTADSSWFGAAGIPTLDGLGPVGFDEHTGDERMLVPTLFERALLVAKLIPAIEESLP